MKNVITKILANFIRIILNVLFINYTYPDPKTGGTSRSVLNISKYLYSKGFGLFVAFFRDEIGGYSIFKDTFKFNGKDSKLLFLEFLKNYQINVVINYIWDFDFQISQEIRKKNIIFINTLNEDPLYFYKLSNNIIKNKEFYYESKWILRRKLSWFYKFGALAISNRRKKRLLNLSDKYVVLSESHKPTLIEMYKLNKSVSSKIVAISNPTSFTETDFIKSGASKENRVLIVSRFDDTTKRITMALKIWKIAQERINNKTWQLDIVGDGDDKEKIMKFSNDISVKNVNFYPVQEPNQFYKRSKIFLMTSCAEGLPNTLLEAQQFGCIPLAFHSFASLNDIIIDKENGFIIENDNIEQYSNKLSELINNPEILDSMIEFTMASTKRFDIEVIGPKWLELLSQFN